MHSLAPHVPFLYPAEPCVERSTVQDVQVHPEDGDDGGIDGLPVPKKSGNDPQVVIIVMYENRVDFN